jgi:hypothetical protein
MRQLFQMFLALFVVMGCSCSKERCVRYEIIDILSESDNSGRAYSINQNGDVAGVYYEEYKRAYLFCWDAEKKTVICGPELELDFEGHVWIDNQRNIICQKFSSEFQKRLPFLWNPSTGREAFLASDQNRIGIWGLNNKNQALLARYGLEYDTLDTLIWDISENKCVRKIDKFMGKALNDKGTVAGVQYHDGIPHAAILGEDGKITIIDDTPKEWSWATHINERDETIGWLKEYKGMSFIWSNNKGLKKLGYIPDRYTFFNGGQTKAHSINNTGQVVGWSSYSTVSGPFIWPFVFRDDGRAFYWDEQNGMVDLNELVSNMGDWERLVEAFSINDKGQIVGWGFKVCGRHPFLLIPLAKN